MVVRETDLKLAISGDRGVHSGVRRGSRSSGPHLYGPIGGRNLTDEMVGVYGFDTPVLAGSHSLQFDEGRVVGARFKYSF